MLCERRDAARLVQIGEAIHVGVPVGRVRAEVSLGSIGEAIAVGVRVSRTRLLGRGAAMRVFRQRSLCRAHLAWPRSPVHAPSAALMPKGKKQFINSSQLPRLQNRRREGYRSDRL